jgi:hypothetical protein
MHARSFSGGSPRLQSGEQGFQALRQSVADNDPRFSAGGAQPASGAKLTVALVLAVLTELAVSVEKVEMQTGLAKP